MFGFKKHQHNIKLNSFIELLNIAHLNIKLEIQNGTEYMKLEDVKQLLEDLGDKYAENS